MKKFLLAALVLLSSAAYAQNEKEAEVLFGKLGSIETKDIGFFVAPAYGFTSMDGSHASLFNIRAGLGLGSQWSLGGFGSVSMNRIMPQSETVTNVYMDYWVAGGFVEYTLLSKKLFHLSVPVGLGYGEVQMDNEAGAAGLGEANFIQFEPGALLEINLHPYVRLNAGLSYRLLSDFTYRNLNEQAISGLTGQIGLKFGLFR